MSSQPKEYEVISVSLPRKLVQRTNQLIPRTRRSRVVRELLASFLDSIERKQLERAYAAYYSGRSARDAEEERRLLGDWQLTDDEAWAILEREEPRGRRPAR